MRFMILLRATEETEASAPPSEDLFREMAAFNEALVNAGVMLAGEGLHPSAKGARVHFDGSERRVERGPFPVSDNMVTGFWIWQLPSLDEAIEWVKRCPNPTGASGRLEIRQIMEMEDFGPELTEDLRQREQELRARAAQ